MNTTEFHKLLKGKFPFELTIKQDVVLQRLANFVLDTKEDNLFILKGYAGTGKTTLIGTLVNSLWNAHKSSVLLAPTGRAAKVISKYAKREALTIHKKIYFPKKESGGGVSFVLQPNKNKNTIFYEFLFIIIILQCTERVHAEERWIQQRCPRPS